MKTTAKIIPAAGMLLCSLFVYLFYRTEKTVITSLCARFFGNDFEGMRTVLQTKMPLPEFIVYNLPEILWVSTFTLLAGRLYINLMGRRIRCFWVPLCFAAGLEVMQMIPGFPGRFDWLDLSGTLISWALAVAVSFRKEKHSQNLFRPFNRRSLAFTGCYLLMYLAHVWR